MLKELKEWSEEEAKEWFNRIESNNGKGEGYDIDWKEKWNFGQTGFGPEETNNTTQRVVSGFANTYGGTIVFGFSKRGSLVGVEEKKDIENYFQQHLENKIFPHPPLFKVKYYPYKEKQILVLFVETSKVPLQCDNGVYYYREQSEFKFMRHHQLENKFRRCFDEEKYLFLVLMDLKQLINYCNKMYQDLLHGGQDFYKISSFSSNILISGDKLYHFYKENILLLDYENIISFLKISLAEEGQYRKQFIYFKDLREKLEAFQAKFMKAANEK